MAGIGLLGAASAELPHLGVPATPALPERCAGPTALDASVFLLGDAGAPRTPEPLLEALVEEARAAVEAVGADRVAIAFLGDNVYPEGLRAADDLGRAIDERRLDAQLDAVRRSGARGLLVPGNHDWANGGAEGWEAVKRQTRYVAARGAAVLPPNGCPGPATALVGDRVGLVAIDSQWWLHAHAKPADAGAGCAESDVATVEAALAATLGDLGDRHAIVVAHHPLASGGPHGANFGFREHLFPFLEVDSRAWMPLPFFGSIAPVLRALGASDQDVPGPKHRAFAAALGRSFAARPPLVYAAGHDHSLQLLRAGPAQFQVVSGAGSAANLTWVYPVAGSLFGAAESGFVRLDAYDAGAVDLTVRTLDARGIARTAFSACLAE
jgi:hypothetical protein